ncbi:major facilitator superfamily domain-containing protein [Cunninghamella echinulata]|nr:major facilitator superfamily domain-containing protein [Cunninghamella echinulata]
MATEQDKLLTKKSSSSIYYTIQFNQNNNKLISVQENRINNDTDHHYTEEINNKLGDISLPLLTLCSNLSVWVITSYLLVSSALQPMYAKLSDIFGRKTVLVYILCFFLVGSFACGAAQSISQLGIARGISGVGGGGLFSLSSILIHDLIPMQKRGQYQSYIIMSQTLGTIIGAPLGGLINDFFGWRHCFYVNIPPCLFILYVYVYRLKDYNLTKEKEFYYEKVLKAKWKLVDYWGALILFMANISFIVAASSGGNTRPWSDPLIITLLVLSPTFFILFGMYEMKWAEHPLVSRKLIKNRNCVAVCLNNFFLCNSTMALIYAIPQYFTGVLGYAPSYAGLWVGPRACMVAMGCLMSGRYLGWQGKYYKYIVILMAFNVLSNIWSYLWRSETSSLWFYFTTVNIEGYTFGAVFVATMVALVADIDQKDNAAATSMIFLCRSSGWLLGGAISAGILQAKLKDNLIENIKGPEADDIIEFNSKKKD